MHNEKCRMKLCLTSDFLFQHYLPLLAAMVWLLDHHLRLELVIDLVWMDYYGEERH